ncbi:MAG: radical SAM protein [Sandaracinaceae bacterium]
MLTEEVHSAGVADARIAQHEDAAHEKRNWVRLTFDCNNKCVFCLDSLAHDGEMRDPDEVKRQILDGRKKGATRLILSGGEPTIHPRYVDFIRLGRLAGYRRIQTVTNGRLFAYQEFLDKCLAAGLHEITFSLHGPNERIHDALVGVKGAFVQESAGLRRALDDGRPIVNVDIVINRGNVRVLPEMLETFYAWGVREFDLLQVVPFGSAFKEGRDILFYDLEEYADKIAYALEFSTRPDVHVWFNRFPPPHLEGFEHLIQDPYKLNDEVRGRKEEFQKQLKTGVPLECREPDRCKYCYLQQLCDVLEDVQTTLHTRSFEAIRLDPGFEAALPPVFGGDPASSKRAMDDEAVRQGEKRRLPLLAADADEGGALAHVALRDRAKDAPLRRLAVRAEDIDRARAALGPYADVLESDVAIELELDDYAGLEGLGHAVAAVVATTAAQADALIAEDRDLEVIVLLNRDTAPWLEAWATGSRGGRIAIRQPSYERLTEAAERDVDAPAFFARFAADVPVEGLPACVIGRAPRAPEKALDAAMLDPDGRLEIFRFARRYILERYRSKSRRCRGCAHDAGCGGLHINQVRAHGYRWMSPVSSEAGTRSPR